MMKKKKAEEPEFQEPESQEYIACFLQEIVIIDYNLRIIII